jgi:aryl-alcohol dehydrogenase-like predicted oxidoreductase
MILEGCCMIGKRLHESVSLDDAGMRSSVLGFGCAAIMGRAGRKASLTALSAAYDNGITFFDTARSYGYGESEALLGEFLQGRRGSVILSTKFGILPTPSSRTKRLLKPVARTLFRLIPDARTLLRSQMAAQLSPGHFTVTAMHQSLEASLRALRTDYVDLFFLHEPPVSALQQQDLFAALQQLAAQGKVRRFGIAANRDLVESALAAKIPGLSTAQFPCNLFNLSAAARIGSMASDVIAIANHPFGGPQRVAQSKALLLAAARDPQAAASLREKLRVVDDQTLADVVLHAITTDTSVKVVVPSMLQVDHLRANIAALEQSRFNAEDLRWIRTVFSRNQPLEQEH